MLKTLKKGDWLIQPKKSFVVYRVLERTNCAHNCILLSQAGYPSRDGMTLSQSELVEQGFEIYEPKEN